MESNMIYSKAITSSVLVLFCISLFSEQNCLSDTKAKMVVTSDTKVQLENGIEVELVAVSNWQWKFVWERHLKALGFAEDHNTDLWWRPNGVLLENVDFRRGSQSSGNTRAFNFLIKATGIKDGDVVATKQAYGDHHRIYKGDIRDSQRNPMKDYFVYYIADFPYPPSTTSLFVGIATGEWHVVESDKQNWSEYEPDRINWGFDSALAGKWPYQKGKHVKVELSHTYVNAQTRLEMIDVEGNIHIADQHQRSTGLGIVNVHYTFKNTNLDEVIEIRFMKRDYTQWIEFKDIILAFDGIKPFYTWGRLLELKGKPAPEFAQIQQWSTGTPLKIADFKGKVVLLDFWNTNCPPCIAMFPKLMSLHDRYHKSGLIIIGVHADIGVSTAQAQEKIAVFKDKFWQGRNIPFPIAFDGGGDTERPNTTVKSWGATNAAYAITSYPTSILIDKKGHVFGEIRLYESGFEKHIESLLKQ